MMEAVQAKLLAEMRQNHVKKKAAKRSKAEKNILMAKTKKNDKVDTTENSVNNNDDVNNKKRAVKKPVICNGSEISKDSNPKANKRKKGQNSPEQAAKKAKLADMSSDLIGQTIDKVANTNVEKKRRKKKKKQRQDYKAQLDKVVADVAKEKADENVCQRVNIINDKQCEPVNNQSGEAQISSGRQREFNIVENFLKTKCVSDNLVNRLFYELGRNVVPTIKVKPEIKEELQSNVSNDNPRIDYDLNDDDEFIDCIPQLHIKVNLSFESDGRPSEDGDNIDRQDSLHNWTLHLLTLRFIK